MDFHGLQQEPLFLGLLVGVTDTIVFQIMQKQVIRINHRKGESRHATLIYCDGLSCLLIYIALDL